MKNLFLIIIIMFYNFSVFSELDTSILEKELNISESKKEMLLAEEELQLLENNTDKKFAYLSPEIKKILLKLNKEKNWQWSKLYNEFCQHLEDGASIASYESTLNIIQECLKNINQNKPSNEIVSKIQEYYDDLNSGNALIKCENENNRLDLKCYRRKIICNLIVKNCLNIGRQLIVNGAGIFQCLITGDATVKGNLNVDGVLSISGKQIGSTNATNIGTGQGHIFSSQVGNTLQFKTLNQGSNITIADTGDTVTISSTAGGVSGATNIGNGQGHIFSNQVGSTLQFKTLNQGSNITIADTGDTVTISSTTGAIGTANAIALFDGTGGLTQSSAPVTIDVTNNIASLNNVTMIGNLNMQDSTSSSVGVINKGGTPFIHNFGVDNTFIGKNAGNFIMVGNSNSANGANALSSNTTGNNNTADGQAALTNNLSGNNNIALGNNAGSNLLTTDNNIDIGNTGLATDANTIRIGSGVNALPSAGAGTPACFIDNITGIVNGIGTTVTINANGQLGISPSAIKFKENITDMQVTDNLMKLRPVTFTFKSDPTKTKQYGLQAEEVNKIYPELVIRDKNNEILTVQYISLISILLKHIQKLTKKMDHIEKKLNFNKKNS